MKDGFKARNFWGGAIRALTDEEAGRLIKAVFEYTTTGKQPKLQGAEKGIFLMIASILKEDEEEERRQIENKVKAGAAGGKKRVANQASQAGACSACYMRFTKIAEVLNYGESTIRVWHQKGLERLESFLNPDENLAENSGK